MARLEQRLRDLEDQVYVLRRTQQELAARLRQEDWPRPGGASAAVEADGGGVRSEIPEGGTVRAVPEPPGPVNGGTDPEWQKVEGLVERGQFKQAVERLGEWLRRHPADPRSGQAQYLLGEAYYGLGNFAQAIVEYDKLVASHPDDRHAPEALYKIGLSYYELGYEDNARLHLERLVSAYPGSRPAEAARPLLQRLRRR